jgi:hypothetical protein
MKKIKSFSAFGKQYRTEQFSAVQGLDLLYGADDAHPCELLSKTEVFAADGVWRCLSEGEVINANVVDVAGVLAPRVVLNGLLSLVHDFNFQFLAGWKSAKVPSRFTDDSNSISSANIPPMAAQLIQDGAASLRELEEYYSLEDAFKMFDTIMVKGINHALSHESAMKKNKQR